jgi:hypothetical protein
MPDVDPFMFYVELSHLVTVCCRCTFGWKGYVNEAVHLVLSVIGKGRSNLSANNT